MGTHLAVFGGVGDAHPGDVEAPDSAGSDGRGEGGGGKFAFEYPGVIFQAGGQFQLWVPVAVPAAIPGLVLVGDGAQTVDEDMIVGLEADAVVVDGGWTVCAEWETEGPTRFATDGS